MKIEDLFTSFDLSSQLYFANMGDDTLYSYCDDGKGGIVIRRKYNKKNWLVPAYTSEEILLKLPPILNLGTDFYLADTKYVPNINEYGYRVDDYNIRLNIERTEDDTNHRFIAGYNFPGRLGRVGVKHGEEIKSLYENSFYLPDAIGKLFLLLHNLNLMQMGIWT